MTAWLLASLLLPTMANCAYLRTPEGPAATCAEAGPGRGAPPCETGLPPGERRRLRADGRVCAAGRLYEPVDATVFDHPGPAAPLPEAAGIARLCGKVRKVRPVRRRWWLPAIAVSVERGLWWSPDKDSLSVATTVWVELSFPLSPEGRLSSTAQAPVGELRRRRELCAASARLGRAFLRVQDVELRTRARLQLMAWRDELSAMEPEAWNPTE